MTSVTNDVTTTRKKTTTKPKEADAQEVPVQIHDPLYGEIIASMEADLHAMRVRAEAAESRVDELAPIAENVSDLADVVRALRTEVTTLQNTVNSMNTYVTENYNRWSKVFRS